MFGIRRLVSAGPLAAAWCAVWLGLVPSTVLAAGLPGLLPEPATEETTVREEIVVTATRVETPSSQVGSSVTVLEGEDLRERGFSSVADALRSTPGLEVSRSGGPGQITGVFLRGGSTSQTLVLLDGVRLNSATTGAFDFADLTLDEVERIEIVRGPQSPLYGSEAAAGVIQIFTRRGEPGQHYSALGEIGEAEHHRLRLAAGAVSAERGWRARLSLADEAIEATSAADARRSNNELDRHTNRTIAGSFGFAPSERQHFGLDVRYFDGDAEIDGYAFSAGPVDDLDAALERQATIVGLSYQAQPRRDLSVEARFGYSGDDLAATDPTDPFGSYTINSRERELGVQLTFDRGSHRLTLGGSREERRGGTELAFDAEVDINGAFVQDLIQLGERASLTLGLRRDEHSSFGGKSTGRAALAWQLSEGGRLHASWGQGFKAPTLNDLYYPFFSNPDLLPERSEAFDVGFEQRFGGDRWQADLTYFDSDFEDLIAFDFVTFLPQNIARASSRGVESQLRFRAEDGRLQAGVSYTFNETEDQNFGTQLARRPEHRATADISYRPNKAWRVAAHAVAVQDRIDSDGSALEDYTRFDLSFSSTWGRFEPAFRVLNVTDDDTSEVGGFGSQGRTAILSVALTF